MRTRTSLVGIASTLVLGCAILASAVPATAYTACHSSGDCWHTDSKVHFKGARISYHEDSWWDAHKSNARYHWHETDNDHDWHHGYWKAGEWHHD